MVGLAAPGRRLDRNKAVYLGAEHVEHAEHDRTTPVPSPLPRRAALEKTPTARPVPCRCLASTRRGPWTELQGFPANLATESTWAGCLPARLVRNRGGKTRKDHCSVVALREAFRPLLERYGVVERKREDERLDRWDRGAAAFPHSSPDIRPHLGSPRPPAAS